MPNEFQIATWEECLERIADIQQHYSDHIKGGLVPGSRKRGMATHNDPGKAC
jgi:hypothetical protein